METTFVKGLLLIEALAGNRALGGVSELARHLSITKSNAHRLLQTLVASGYARNLDRSGRYALTLKLWEIGTAVVAQLDLKAIGSEYLESLCRLSDETVHLSVLEGDEVVYLDKLDSPHPVRAYSRVGGRAPAYCVATGKAILAHGPAAVADAIALRLAPFTAATITTPGALRKELAAVRARGYAVNHGEWRDGVWGVGAPILDAGGRVCAAIGLSGPAERFKPRRLKQLAPMVVDVARQISLRLGHRPAGQTPAAPVKAADRGGVRTPGVSAARARTRASARP